MKLTNEIIEEGKSKYGGWNREQLKIFGIEWKPLKGWKRKIINKDFPTEEIYKFLKLKDKHFQK